MRPITESDWKLFRQFHRAAVERFCCDVLEKLQQITSDDCKSYHERYLAIYDLIRRRDKELARAFDDFRRSTAPNQIANLYHEGFLTEEEISRFSDETRSIVQFLLGGGTDS